MTPAYRPGVSDREVWAAIHYLDPDLEEIYSHWQKQSQTKIRTVERIAIVAISVAALVAAVGLLISRFLH